MAHPADLACAIPGASAEARGIVVRAAIVLGAGYGPTDELGREIQAFVEHRTGSCRYPARSVHAVTRTVA